MIHLMKRIASCAFVFLLMLAFADAKPARPPRDPGTPPRSRNLVGVYTLSHKAAPTSGVAKMKIWAQSGSTFSVAIAERTGIAGLDWEGRGVIDGNEGYYDWTFADGKKGRTTFTVDLAGKIHGQVRGSRLDWDYIGVRLETPTPK